MEPILKQSGSRGQMTIEFALLFPVMLMIALIACNSILFLSECASFDRIFRESVCVFAPSPASEETTGQICAHIEDALAQFNERDYLSCNVSQPAKIRAALRPTLQRSHSRPPSLVPIRFVGCSMSNFPLSSIRSP